MTETAERTPVDVTNADRVADIAAVDGLLRCWMRENDLSPPDDGVLELELPAAGVRLRAVVIHHSAVGQHRFGTVSLDTGVAISAVTVAALLAVEAAAGRGTDPGAVTDLVGRVADSTTRIAHYVRSRSETPEDPVGATPFLTAEQGLILGHPTHPAPKSRLGLSEADSERFSPELRGSFPLHWFAADRSVVSGDGPDLVADFAPDVPEGMVPVPAHPWQAREVRSRPGVRGLLESGLLRDLGESGAHWYPTASIRTVYHPDAPVMLKFSLGLPITNSKRENLRAELRRGLEIDRILEAGLAAALAEAHPGFGIVRDPAWLAVDVEDATESGLELVVRDNPFGPHDRAACVAGLLAERPDRDSSEIAAIVTNLAAATGEDSGAVAERWCARYFDSVIAPVLWLYRTYGLGLEAHQQNTVVLLDEQGWPRGGWYRDNQGYYISQRRVGELERFLPDIGVAGVNRWDDAIIDERLGYYIGINNLLGLVGALGSHGLADERRLLAVLHRRLRDFPDLSLARTLAHAPTLRCKANLLTRMDGLDELVGPLESQSVYCDITNPIAEVGTPP
ncbi:siderophore synthetase component [Saccharopolyspora lacisalsi]|uniref:Siderophore synthetase component n=1 Tax=Halosaccharopolyspora lacisalsi TaxID=1000566 RepID=A0A839E4Q6_9PSEU|nr:IucA/IucC family protein [Halosaccharopolyspora lacisalsi]MBA8826805.1 siderophore synthetase component [Halosaccharopolyspora lacisalsi]